ncbi:MAG: GIY-YIG nuclease family protein [Desulfoprunum sp.]|nr:GIY-YIG nuclease family protein [Desulfoprunum sp.]
MTSPNPWFTYIIRCSDKTLYTGVTTDLVRRLAEHNSLRGGARYTRARQPVQLVFAEKLASRSLACRREYAIKQLSAAAKKQLINDQQEQDNDVFPP